MSKTPFLPDPKNQIQLQRTPEKTSRQSVKKMKKKKKPSAERIKWNLLRNTMGRDNDVRWLKYGL
jgi:hypothetical protein